MCLATASCYGAVRKDDRKMDLGEVRLPPYTTRSWMSVFTRHYLCNETATWGGMLIATSYESAGCTEGRNYLRSIPFDRADSEHEEEAASSVDPSASW